MSELTIAFPRQWTIRTPVVTRIMARSYIDSFFEDGSLRLSSFDSFNKHPDEDRRDQQEGNIAMKIDEPNGSLNILARNGQEAYVLCGSLAEMSTTKEHSKDSSFRILNTLAFADAISRQIPGFLGGVEGSCTYRDNTMISKKGSRKISPPENQEEVEEWFNEQNRYVGKQAIEGFFVKHSKFAHESEYRFIWFAEGHAKPHIDIKCPAAREFCERIEA